MKIQPISLAIGMALTLIPIVSTAAPQEKARIEHRTLGTFTYTRNRAAFEDRGADRQVQGTLLLPRRNRTSPGILFVTGARTRAQSESGAETETLNRLAEYLASHGIAVLQIETRPGARAAGDFRSATTAGFETDIRAALTYLKARPEINPRQIGLFGQGENGAIAAVLATLTNDISYLVLAGTGVAEGAPPAAGSGQAKPSARTSEGYDLRPYLKHVSCPVLALQGDQDTTLPLRENLTAIREALAAGGNHITAFAALPGLNHRLASADGSSETAMAPLAMQTMTEWVTRHVPVRDTPDSDNDELVTKEDGTVTRKPSNPFGDVPGGVIGQFKYRPSMQWQPAIGGQARPYGYWYW